MHMFLTWKIVFFNLYYLVIFCFTIEKIINVYFKMNKRKIVTDTIFDL